MSAAKKAAGGKEKPAGQGNGNEGSFAPSCLLTRDRFGSTRCLCLGESADLPLQKWEELKKARGFDADTGLTYTAVQKIIRGKASSRLLKFT